MDIYALRNFYMHNDFDTPVKLTVTIPYDKHMTHTYVFESVVLDESDFEDLIYDGALFGELEFTYTYDTTNEQKDELRELIEREDGCDIEYTNTYYDADYDECVTAYGGKDSFIVAYKYITGLDYANVTSETSETSEHGE